MGLGISPLTIFDLSNLLTLVKSLNKMKKIEDKSLLDYTILCTTYNSSIPLKNINYLNKIKEKVIICDDGSNKKDFLDYLNKLEKQGFKVVRNGKKKYIKWAFLKRVITIPSREQALKEGLEFVRTKYTIFLDDDSIPKGDIGKAVYTLDKNNAQLASVKIFPSNRDNLIENLQTIEYSAAMLGREIRPYLTSGACLIGETNTLKEICKRHSLFYQGGDIEIGVLAKRLKKKIIHIDFIVETEVPNTIKKWIKQRAYWMSGNFRHTVVNFHNYIMHDPLHIFYFTGIVWLMLIFKWISNFSSPLSLFYIFLAYIPITLIANLKIVKIMNKYVRWYSYLLFPLYALFQIIILPFAGIFLYFKQAIRYNNFGIISIKIRNKG